MSTLAIVLIVIAVLIVFFLLGGLLGARKRDEKLAPEYLDRVAAADQSLEVARAADRGWEPALLEVAVREALDRSHPGVAFVELRLVLVDDRPGVIDDVAHFEAVREGDVARVVLTRSNAGWRGETVS